MTPVDVKMLEAGRYRIGCRSTADEGAVNIYIQLCMQRFS